MPTEENIKKLAKEHLKKQGYQVWYPVRSRWGKERDIFGIFDGIAWKEDQFIFFQLTTMPNKSARYRKIKNYMNKHNLFFNSAYVKGMIIAFDDLKGLRFFEIL